MRMSNETKMLIPSVCIALRIFRLDELLDRDKSRKTSATSAGSYVARADSFQGALLKRRESACRERVLIYGNANATT